MTTPPQFLTVAQAAGHLGVPPQTLHKWLLRGWLQGTQDAGWGRRWRIPLSEVRAHRTGTRGAINYSACSTTIPNAEAYSCSWQRSAQRRDLIIAGELGYVHGSTERPRRRLAGNTSPHHQDDL